ncbi:MAG: hypothetical protein EOR30_00755 [Mesorhizobium sp.]|nr:hypothetical protein EOA78_03170 [Mesorhizobium sp. M5C.F.Cr.IN.023.01.1.1]RWF89534.1 MAG: hypothetical protein EOQ36_04570 [Mesorhizobium sp.]RWF97011.1 MAG: hypothetical protein EOQ45_00210 [Mesorhizobium sp.]RWI42464.1 MAG: hypothetical protein EOR14_04870 [Mesorhizobium sp.]RWI53468.1 MAG: hypothetical protein EOR15_01675 [Mesorhizobium sp.]
MIADQFHGIDPRRDLALRWPRDPAGFRRRSLRNAQPPVRRARSGPNPRWAETYRRTQPVFDRLYRHSQALYDDIDALAAATRPTQP